MTKIQFFMKRIKAPLKNSSFVFKKNSSVGSADAMEDLNFLHETFIDTGDLEILRDTSKPQCIAVGRTGSGKTALIERLSQEENHVIKIDVASLALNYISNNSVIKFFEELEINLDPFYKLLWKHVLAVELIRKSQEITDEVTNKQFLSRMRDRFSKRGKELEAFNYFAKWNNEFWKDTDEQVQGITRTVATELEDSIDGKLRGSAGGFGAGIEVGSAHKESLNEEQKLIVKSRGQDVISRVQLAKLTRILGIIDSEMLNDSQKPYFITIDRLDEDWVDSRLRYKLIRALLETTREFNSQISNLKIIIAMREDLINRVFRYTRSSGQQEEKYKSMNLPIRWKPKQLTDLLEERVNALIKEQYTSQRVTLKSILPEKATRKEEDPIKYMIDRTMLRPRDLIMFFNNCIEVAQGKAKIGKQNLLDAEEKYSRDRLRALGDEWSSDYPNLVHLCFCMKTLPKSFKTSIDELNVFESNVLNFLASSDRDISRNDYIFRMCEEKFNSNQIVDLFDETLKLLFKVGVVGVKSESYNAPRWSYLGQEVLSTNDKTVFYIHPMLWRVLGVQP